MKKTKKKKNAVYNKLKCFKMDKNSVHRFGTDPPRRNWTCHQ